ncbi:MAG: 30S ribosomal protein S2 [Nitrososphaeraceae archaeon]
MHYLKVRQVPSAVFFFNKYNIAQLLKETNAYKLPIISLADTNTNINLMTYPIPSNDNSFILNTFYSLLIYKIIVVSEYNKYKNYLDYDIHIQSIMNNYKIKPTFNKIPFNQLKV